MSDDGRSVHLLGDPSHPAAGSGTPEPVVPADFRDVMSRFATGVVVITVGGDRIHGMTANAFTSVSLEPPLLLCCIARSAVMHEAIESTGSFAVSIMSAGQQGLARYFADRKRPLGAAQFDTVDWWAGPRTGAPLLRGALGWIECRVSSSHQGGDHSIFIGSVLGLGRGPVQQGLLFFDGGFRDTEPSGR
jgi:flavin reductase